MPPWAPGRAPAGARTGPARADADMDADADTTAAHRDRKRHREVEDKPQAEADDGDDDAGEEEEEEEEEQVGDDEEPAAAASAPKAKAKKGGKTSAEAHQEGKQKLAARKSTRKDADVVAAAVALWEKLRVREGADDATRAALVGQILALVRGKILDVRAHRAQRRTRHMPMLMVSVWSVCLSRVLVVVVFLRARRPCYDLLALCLCHCAWAPVRAYVRVGRWC
jgi:hypothetical protein